MIISKGELDSDDNRKDTIKGPIGRPLKLCRESVVNEFAYFDVYKYDKTK